MSSDLELGVFETTEMNKSKNDNDDNNSDVSFKGGNSNNHDKKNNNKNTNSNQSCNCKNSNQGNKGETMKKHILGIVEKLRKKSRAYPLDSAVLYLLYRCGTVILFHIAMIGMCSLYLKDNIFCVEEFNGAKNVDAFVVNICLSYPYLQRNSSKKRFLLFYRWLPYILMKCACLAYIPRILMKWFNYPRLQHLLKELSNISHWYENTNWKKTEDKIARYFEENLGNHRSLYMLFVFNHIMAVAIVASLFAILDFTLQNRFLMLPFDVTPINRDPETFQDDLSQAFPPFVSCEITPSYGMLNRRTQSYRCHLTLMELYEKIFFVMWFLLTSYVIIGVLYLMFILVLPLPPCNRFFLNTPLQPKDVSVKCRYLVRTLETGDVYCLHLIKKLLTPVQFECVVGSVYNLVHRRRRTPMPVEQKAGPSGVKSDIGFIPTPPVAPDELRKRKPNKGPFNQRLIDEIDLFGENIVLQGAL